MGALALFGEKYGEQVRVVEVGDYSRELCGGTHVARSGQLGLVKILGESSIGSGVRRVEALVGMDAFRFLAAESLLVSQLAEQLKARREELPERVAGIVTRLRDARARPGTAERSAQLLDCAAELAQAADDVAGVAFVAHRAPDGTAADGIRKLALDIRGRLAAGRPGVAIVDRVSRPAAQSWWPSTTRAAPSWPGAGGAGRRPAAAALGGRGGGQDDVAQGGGAPLGDRTDQAISDSFSAVARAIQDIVGSSGLP